MKGYFCVDCGKEVPVVTRNNVTMFYCECNGVFKHVAYLRDVDDKLEK